jgi:hypothetical protein
MARLILTSATRASLRRNRQPPRISKLLACASTDDALGRGPAFVGAKLTRIMPDELLSALLTTVAPDMFRIDILQRLCRLQASEHWRSIFLAVQKLRKAVSRVGHFRDASLLRCTRNASVAHTRVFRTRENSSVFMRFRRLFADPQPRPRY